jgi:MFS family permease
MSATGNKERLITREFAALMATTTFYFLAYGTVTPVLPLFVTHHLHGGNLAVGLVVGSFAVSAIVTRPLAGRLGNRAGRRWLLFVGSLIAGGSIAAYPAAGSTWMLVGLRLLTGVGEGCFYTGSATIVSDLAPPSRRGEAISLYSVAIWIGNGLGPAIGQNVYRAGGATASFLTAAALCGVAVLLGSRITEPVVDHGEILRTPLVHRRALLPGWVLALTIAGTTAFNAYVPLYVRGLGMSGPQFVFLAYAAVVLGIRIVFATLPDRWGPIRTGTVATSSVGLGFLLVAGVHTALGLYLGAVVIALGNSLIFPALMSMALAHASPRERAPIVGTFSGFFDISAGLGGIVLGTIAAAGGYRVCFASSAAFAASGLGLLRTRGIKAIARLADAASPDSPESWPTPHNA